MPRGVYYVDTILKASKFLKLKANTADCHVLKCDFCWGFHLNGYLFSSFYNMHG